MSFQYRRSNEQDRRGRVHGLPSDLASNQLSQFLQGFHIANAESVRDTSSSARAVSNLRETSECEPSSSHALTQSFGTAPLEDSSFPPLPVPPRKGKKKTKKFSTASHQAWSTANFPPPPNSLLPNSNRPRPVSNSGLLSSSGSPSIPQSRSTTRNTHLSSSNVSTPPVRLVKSYEFASSSFASSSGNSTNFSMVTHSASGLNLVGRRPVDNSVSDFPPVSASQTGQAPKSTQALLKAEDVNAANKSLVERIRIALDHDEKKYTAFKEISSQYRRDLVSTEEYLAYVCQFGLSHLVLELARLCPDPEKQSELIETYNFNTRSCGSHYNSLSDDSGPSKNKKSSKKGKEKCEENEVSTSKDVLADNIISSMRKLESNYKSLVGRVDVLSKDGHQSTKEKSRILNTDESQIECHQSPNESPRLITGDNWRNISGSSGGGNKQRKKVSKFLRNRLGNDAAAISELGSSNTGPELTGERIDDAKDPPEGLPVGGVWQNGGGRRLVAMTQRDRRKR